MTDRYEESPMKKLTAFFYEDEIERLNGEIERLRAALRRIQRPEAETIDGVIKWIKEDAERLAFARSALEENK